MNDILPDIPRLYTALAEWLACMVYIIVLRKRLTKWKIVMLTGTFLLVQSVYLIITKNLPITLWIPVMILAIGMMFLLIYICCDLSAIEAGYFSVRAFVAAELVASLEWQVHFFFFFEEERNVILEVSLLVFIYGVSFLIIWLLERKHIPLAGRLNIRNRELWSAIIIGMAVFGISNLSFISTKTPFSGQYGQDILNVRTLVDLGGFAILYAYHIQLNGFRIRHELAAVQNILQNQYIQYQQSKESIEIINYKYHDLKNQIIALKSLDSSSERHAYLNKMEDDIKFYEAQYKTGNNVLDTVLASKNIHCMKNNITLTCVANGSLLNHVDVIDICTIFGNALDNAIEYTQRLEDEEKRLIHVSVFAQKKFLIIRIENYFEGNLEYESGLPITTKKDAYNHGYGLKSIQYTIRKYDGVVNINQKNNWFELNILMPLSNDNIEKK